MRKPMPWSTSSIQVSNVSFFDSRVFLPQGRGASRTAAEGADNGLVGRNVDLSGARDGAPDVDDLAARRPGGSGELGEGGDCCSRPAGATGCSAV